MTPSHQSTSARRGLKKAAEGWPGGYYERCRRALIHYFGLAVYSMMIELELVLPEESVTVKVIV